MKHMRLAILAVLSFVSANANATLIRVDYGMLTDPRPEVWLSSQPIPGSVHLTFTVDTNSARSSEITMQTPFDGVECVSRFDFRGIYIYDVAVSSASLNLGASTSSTDGRFRGAEPSGRCPSGFFGGLDFSTDDLVLQGSIDFLGVMAEDLNSGRDPLEVLITRAFSRQLDVQLLGEWGKLTAYGFSGTVREVPEPGPFGLFAMGVVAVALMRRQIVRRTVPM